MFIGHFALAFATKPVQKSLSLGSMFLAAQFVDLLWPTLLLLGIEKAEIVHGADQSQPVSFTYYPYSHSLLMTAVWALLAASSHYFFRRDRRAALVIGWLVLSHWFLDVLVHAPDLPVYDGSAKLGLGLWSFPAIENMLEILMFGVGVWLYARSTRAVGLVGAWGLWSLVALLFMIQVANAFGSPPPNITTVAWMGQAQWLLVIWAYFVDRHRGLLRVQNPLSRGLNLT